MRLSSRTLLTALLLVILGTDLAYAQNKGSGNDNGNGNSSKQLMVLGTSVDRNNQTLTIQGLDFGSQTPLVWCEMEQMTVISATNNQIVVFLPAAGPNGTHLLTVSRGNSAQDIGFFNVYFGAGG